MMLPQQHASNSVQLIRYNLQVLDYQKLQHQFSVVEVQSQQLQTQFRSSPQHTGDIARLARCDILLVLYRPHVLMEPLSTPVISMHVTCHRINYVKTNSKYIMYCNTTRG